MPKPRWSEFWSKFGVNSECFAQLLRIRSKTPNFGVTKNSGSYSKQLVKKGWTGLCRTMYCTEKVVRRQDLSITPHVPHLYTAATVHYTIYPLQAFSSRQAANRILWSVSQAICLSGVFPFLITVILSLILCLLTLETSFASWLG